MRSNAELVEGGHAHALAAAWLGLALICLGTIACSPEAARTRGGGPGADVGNHGTPVQLHGDTRPYHDTVLRGAGR